jgi:hypothetical protein
MRFLPAAILAPRRPEINLSGPELAPKLLFRDSGRRAMTSREELMRRYDAAVVAAVETAESMTEWSDETRMAVALTIRLLGNQFSHTLTLALAADTDPVSAERIAEVEKDWGDFLR